MEADPSHAEGGRPLQLLAKTGPCPDTLGLILGGGIEHVSRVDNDMPKLNTGLIQGRVEALDSIRLHGGPVAVILRWRGKDLEGPQPRGPGSEGRHADTTIENGV
jgi:hypothetical protein